MVAAVKSSRGALKLAQKYVSLREQRRALQKQVDALAEVETAHKVALMDSMAALGVDSLGDKELVYAIKQSLEPSADDWSKVYKYILKTGEVDLLYRRLNNAAVKERWLAGVAIPGITKFPVQTLSVTKAKGAE